MSKRSDEATAATGYGLVGAGGIVRGHAINRAHEELGLGEERLVPPSMAVYGAHRHKVPGNAKITRRFLGGSALVTLGAPAAGLGTAALVHRHRQNVGKADKERNVLVQGAQGTGEAWAQKGRSLRSGAPTSVRARAVAYGTVGAALGSLAAHRGLDGASKLVRVSPHVRNATTAAAAVPGALATLPLSNRSARKRGYRVTPTGTHREVSKAYSNSALVRSLAPYALVGANGLMVGYGAGRTAADRARRRRKVSKAQPQQYRHNDYLGRRVPPRQQRIRTYAAGAAPSPIGPLAAAAQAGRYAPPGQKRHAQARQLSATAAGTGAGLYAGRKFSRVTENSPSVEAGLRRAQAHGARAKAKLPPRAQEAMDAPRRVTNSARRLIGKAPLREGPLGAKALGAVVGYKAASAVVGNAGGQLATSRNIAAQRRFNHHHPVSKGWLDDVVEKVGAGIKDAKSTAKTPAVPASDEHKAMVRAAYLKRYGQPLEERTVKSRFTGRQVAPGSITAPKVSKALDASGMDDHQKRQLVRRKRLGADLTTVAGATGLGALALVRAKHPRAIEHRGKLLAISAGTGGANAFNSAGITRREARAEKSTISKAQPIKTTQTPAEAHKLVHGKGGYGLVGPLPKHLDRPARQQAYEARYIAAGGKKSQRWQHVTNAGAETANAGVAGGTAAGAVWLATKSPRMRKLAAPLNKLKHLEHLNHEAIKKHSEHAAVAAATVGGVGQLTANAARKRRAKYTSAPGGVAASALRRMQAYSPAGG